MAGPGGIDADRDGGPPLTLGLTFSVALTVVTGAMDAITFTRLGEVFSSVMTGNLVLLGVSAGRADGALAVHVAVAVAGFVGGVLIAGVITGPPARAAGRWPPRVSAALGVELALLASFFVGWAVRGGRPDGAVQVVLLLLAAAAMGVQTGAVRAIGISGLSTTYLTGTLAGILATLVTDGRLQRRSLIILAALIVGAAVAALLVVHVPTAAPALPVALLLVVLIGSRVV
jgi:uncharacterized membrane protein YoaK (UPF0700 family)